MIRALVITVRALPAFYVWRFNRFALRVLVNRHAGDLLRHEPIPPEVVNAQIREYESRRRFEKKVGA